MCKIARGRIALIVKVLLRQPMIRTIRCMPLSFEKVTFYYISPSSLLKDAYNFDRATFYYISPSSLLQDAHNFDRVTF